MGSGFGDTSGPRLLAVRKDDLTIVDDWFCHHREKGEFIRGRFILGCASIG